MLQHFQYHPLYKDKRIPGWTFSFYFSGKRLEGIYHQDGKIDWTSEAPDTSHENNLKRQLHDLMLYHVYDQR
ncbi:hypothetical protein D4T97_007790 [Siminovitchia acidinfaciens]|uniref:YheE family protein n=1 Tax=Siminovitchia acidinfaciens TaxID=2321395 RepID=A0A429Y1N4_9BACI|nr:YheE family protein [Siminovitchia acidinfaciens]RST75152.1 hypothetical protein D4T97_007790 [Siminovitchia acidinfaciens]